MPSNGKTLAGVKATPELLSLLSECITRAADASDDNGSEKVLGSARANATAPLPLNEAKPLLKSRSDDDVIPLLVIRAMYSVMDKKSSEKLDFALAQTQLLYSAPPPPQEETLEQRKFQKRMNRLRLRAEEARYMKLTENIDTTKEDDVTTKSMTYAASVGLNMIVAPISFGVFMYFFAGAVFGWVLGEDAQELQPHQTDIKSVIAGAFDRQCIVLVGCCYLSVRTHPLYSFTQALSVGLACSLLK